MFLLAYDQGLEHGPVDFNLYNSDPSNILELALHGGATSFTCHKGIAEKYYVGTKYQNKLPLILKLNGKTSYIKEEPYSPAFATVDEAIELGACGVGYTVFIGSPRQDEMFREFTTIVREAHKKNIPVIGWMYPSLPNVGSETAEFSAYAARVGLELGADIVKVKPHTDPGAMKWIVQCAGKAKVVFKGGERESEEEFLNQVKIDLDSGAIGLAVGRNIWQADNPLEVANKVSTLIWPQ
jgi:class I fructose-bisphosphate aldolase